MRNDRDSRPILKTAYSRRLNALTLLQGALSSADAGAIKSAAAELRKSADAIGEGSAAKGYRIYAGLTEVAAHLISWSLAVKTAEPDGDRHLRAAKVNSKDLITTIANLPFWQSHVETLKYVETISDTDHVKHYLAKVSLLPLPIPFLSHQKAARVVPRKRGDLPKEVAVPRVFLEFTIEGQPFANPQIVSPNVLRDVSVKVSVENWPEHAESLWIHPISIEPSGVYNLQEFSIVKPANLSKAEWQLAGRLMVNCSQSIMARPLEFCYRADFLPDGSSANAIVTGNGRLVVQSHDAGLNPASGYREVDLQLLNIRNLVRRSVNVDDKELGSFLTIMTVLGRTAGKALQDSDFSGKWSEAEFQKHLVQVLRGEPLIGSNLEEHPRAGGGITDLSFNRIRIELKVEVAGLVTMQTANQFVGQTSQYVAGTDRRLGTLCILDCSVKTESPGLVANDIGMISVSPPNGTDKDIPISIGVVIIRGNLLKPSVLSK